MALRGGVAHGDQKNADSYELNEDFQLVAVGGSSVTSGVPFGTFEEIDRIKDEREKAYKILWNVAFAESVTRDALYGFDLAYVGSQSVLRRARGIFFRTFMAERNSKSEEALAESVQVVQGAVRGDMLRFSSPAVLVDLTYLTHRFSGRIPDGNWIYSPVSRATRPVSDANRSDPILGSLLSADDLFIWSARVEGVHAKLAGEKAVLVPILSPEAIVAKRSREGSVFGAPPTPDDSFVDEDLPLDGDTRNAEIITVSGSHRRAGRGRAMLGWNFETGQYPRGAPWVPTTVTFVPRMVWILELHSRDPFYAVGREVLVVDKESMLPVYKVVYDRFGSYSKTLVAGWHFATLSSPKGKDPLRFPFLGFLLAVDRQGARATALSTHTVQTFLGEKSGHAADVYKAMREVVPSEEEEEGKEETPE